ncbi:hypothetical protein [Acinetobacter pragensis]|uniref:Uncharacterized protein n=1 Tax=Acinetobacter pragensis TaxID=1806892 RepID=A0A151XZB1_9GAMM|nr:hypothetical protein [Acinetobacter pragensis]KYQ71075.1 hypothetical protein AZH43_02780 [Acinetobacter pragensis]
MKTILKTAVMASAVSCFAQVQAGQSAVQKMLKPVIEHQCSMELKDSNLWKASTFLMTERNKQQFQQEVCSCVGENALNEVPAAELAHAAVSTEAKNQLIHKAVLNTVKGCVIQLKR